MDRLKLIAVVLLALVFALLAEHLTWTSRDQANAQASAAPTPLFTIADVGTLTASIKGAITNDVVALAITNNETQESSISFYFVCTPNAQLGALGKCPGSGIFVQSQPICEGASVEGVLPCPTPTP
jgi:hypothetical protein